MNNEDQIFWILKTNSHLTCSTAEAELWSSELTVVQRYWPWFAGRVLVIVSTEPPALSWTLSTTNKYNSETFHTCDIVCTMLMPTCYYSWPSNGLLLALFHCTDPAGCAPLPTWQLKLAVPPSITVAVWGSTETTGAWAATAQRHHTHMQEHRHIHMSRATLWTFRQDWVKYSVNEPKPQSKQPEQIHRLNPSVSDDQAKKIKKGKNNNTKME